MLKKIIRIIYCFIVAALLSACDLHNYTAPTNRGHVHVVKPGDTLYSIAKQHKIKLYDLITANHIKVPHILTVKQQLIIPKQKNNYQPIKTNQNWKWPATGKIIKYFSHSGTQKLNGIAIAGKKGETIVAASSGRVVYSGNNLKGYGNLIIIKHDNDFLSAYAHTQKILVKEQQLVSKGQPIAIIGNSTANLVSLHFEIRHKGKPIDPLRILPKNNKDQI